MAEEKPSPVTYHEYNIPSVNKLFLWSSVALLLVSVWMIWADYSRPWKEVQRRFNDVEIARTRAQLAEVGKKTDQKQLDQLKARLQAAEKAADARRADRDRLRAEIDRVAGRWYAADQAYKFIKAELDVARYELDEAKRHDKGVAAAQRKFDHVLAETEKRRLEFEEIDRQKTDLAGRLAALTKDIDESRKAMDRMLEERKRLETKLDKIGHGLVNDWFRDPPLLDFLAPTLKVRQVILPDIHEDVNFLTVSRVDRCHTCHLSIDKPGYAGVKLAPEFRSHSRLETLLGRNHPVERFGCTGCHAGSGRAITFSDVAHTPRDAKQAAAWEEKRGWHRLHHWDFPMLPLSYTEANCANCHREESRVPGADSLNAGREMLEEYGCFGCHKIDRPGFDELRKVGPSLAHIQGKVSHAWMIRWVKDPKSFRPSTRMPRLWGNSNTARATATMNYPLRDDVEAEAVVRYLLERSKPYPALPPPRGSGDAARGKWVVDNRGCKACHVVGADDKGEGRPRAHFGPELNQIGSKLTLEWLYAWIRDPKAMWPDTKMPDLRLSDPEALDAATYLLTLRNPAFEKLPLPDLEAPAARQMLEGLTYEYLRKETTTAEAKERLARMDEAARYAYMGGKLIARYGCFGCHDGTPGFENAQRIGTELSTWASKLLTQLDFGFVDIPHTKHDWLREKLRDPRVYDQGKVETKDPQDLLKMPNFGFTDPQIDKLMTVVLSFQRDLVQLQGHRRLGFEQAAIEKGRRAVHKHNCQGCHVIENHGGGMEKVIEGGKPFAPPVLVADFKLPDGRDGHTLEGAKVQPDWLFAFLKGPTTIRPWLNTRMPTFGLTDDEATDIVRYFALLAKEKFPYESIDRLALPDAQVAEGEKRFGQFQCVKCHLPLEEAKRLGVTPAELAPNLELAKSRLRFEWLARWLKDPGAIQQDTRMPAFFYTWDEDTKAYSELMAAAEDKIQALRAYLQFHGQPRPEGRLAAGRERR